MHRRDYIKAASIVRETRRAIRAGTALGTDAYAVQQAFIQLFRGDNDRFDQGRFESACAGTEV
jgi:hypothetical protein